MTEVFDIWDKSGVVGYFRVQVQWKLDILMRARCSEEKKAKTSPHIGAAHKVLYAYALL